MAEVDAMVTTSLKLAAKPWVNCEHAWKKAGKTRLTGLSDDLSTRYRALVFGSDGLKPDKELYS